MIENFSEKLKKYAELIVKVGVNVQKGQPVVLYICSFDCRRGL